MPMSDRGSYLRWAKQQTEELMRIEFGGESFRLLEGLRQLSVGLRAIG